MDTDDRYRQLFERNTAIQLVADPNSGAILDANRAASDFYGLSHDQLTRLRFADLSVEPEDVWPGQLEVASITGAQFAAFPQRHASGDTRLVDVYAGPLALGERLVVHMIVHDATERARTEERERDLHAERVARQVNEAALQEWQGSFDAIDLPMLVVDHHGRVTRANRAASQLTESGRVSVFGATIDTLAPSLLWKTAAGRMREAQRRGVATAVQVTDAEQRTWEVWAARFVPRDAHEPRYVIVARDLTAMLALQEEVQRRATMARMGELVAGVAHEVRNALFGLTSALDAMRARTGDIPEFARYYPVLSSQVQRLADLTRDLLDFGKPASLDLTPCAVGELIMGALELSKASAESAGVILRGLGDVRGQVLADRAKMLQVLHNLILNAIQHSPKGGVVEVRAVRHEGNGRSGWAFEVQDSGPGFAPDDLPRVFEPFFTRRPGGTGLGLALAHRIVSDHGGRIEALNRPRGGATVRVTLAEPQPLPPLDA